MDQFTIPILQGKLLVAEQQISLYSRKIKEATVADKTASLQYFREQLDKYKNIKTELEISLNKLSS